MNQTDADAVPLPEFVQIEPVGQCNLRCRMCPVVYRDEGTSPQSPGRRPAFMSFDTFCRILTQFSGIRQLQLQGMGEPFLHPRFLDMVRYAAARGIEVSTNTNLTALSQRRARQCVASGLKTLHVSIDSAEPAAYAYIRVGSSLDRALASLDLLVEEKRRTGSADPQIILVAVVMRRNLDQLPDLVRMAHQHGVRSISVQHLAHDFTEATLPSQYRPMRAFVEAETLLAEDPELIERWFDRARRAAEELGLTLRLPNVRARAHDRAKKGRDRCAWPWRGAYVSYSGEAMPCCMIATPDRLSFGNMAKNGVARVWNNAAYEAFREKLASDDPPEVCRGCAVYKGTF